MAVDPSMTWDGDSGSWDTDQTPWDSSQFDLTLNSGINLGDTEGAIRSSLMQFYSIVELGYSPTLTRTYMVDVQNGIWLSGSTDRQWTGSLSISSGVLLGFQDWVYNQVYGNVAFGVNLGYAPKGDATFGLGTVAGVTLGTGVGIKAQWNLDHAINILLGFDSAQIQQNSKVDFFSSVWLDAPMNIRNPWDSDFDQGIPEIWTEVQNGALRESWDPVLEPSDSEDWVRAPDPPPEVQV